MRLRTRGCLAGIASAMCCLGAAEAGPLSVHAGGANLELSVTSFKEARFRKVIAQRYDFSCGSAAVATLLTHYYGMPTGEEAVFKDMYRHGEEEKIRRHGFSLLDMKRYLERRGFPADGYRVSIEKLAEAGLPGIVLLDMRGYRHFVVVHGIAPDEVLIGDPATGTRVLGRREFVEMWNGIAFVILNNVETAQRAFNDGELWRVRTAAPLGVALARDGLASFNMLLPGTNEF
jgi:predicted double-glycine peptidase